MSFRKRNRFKFSEKTQSVRGIVALTVAAVLLILYLVFLQMAYSTKGGLSVYFGAAGFLALVATPVNLVFCILSMREENSYQAIPRLSLIVTILEGICWYGTLFVGIR